MPSAARPCIRGPGQTASRSTRTPSEHEWKRGSRAAICRRPRERENQMSAPVTLTVFKAQKFKCPSCGTVLPESVVRAGRCSKCDARLQVPGEAPRLYKETAREEIERRAALEPYRPPAASSADIDRVIREHPELWEQYRRELAADSTDSSERAEYGTKQARLRTPPAAAIID